MRAIGCSHRGIACLVAAAVVVLVPAAAVAGAAESVGTRLAPGQAELRVELRGTRPAIVAQRLEFEKGGLRVVSGNATALLLAWDDVRAVTGRPLTDDERAFLAMAEDLWRARQRVQRGDLDRAVELFERHAEALRGSTSETALIVAEGIVRCRVARDPLRAVLPALEVARLRRAKITTDRYANLPPVLDEATLLAPAVGAALIGDASGSSDAERLAIAREIDLLLASTTLDGETRRSADLVAAILRRTPLPAVKREEGGAGLLAAIMELDRIRPDETPEAKVRVRSAVVASAKGLAPWATAWARFAVGRSLVAEAALPEREQGVLALLAIPAEAGSVVASDGEGTVGAQAPLSIVRAALELAASTLRSLGDGESAAIVERELAAHGGGTRAKGTRP